MEYRKLGNTDLELSAAEEKVCNALSTRSPLDHPSTRGSALYWQAPEMQNRQLRMRRRSTLILLPMRCSLLIGNFQNYKHTRLVNIIEVFYWRRAQPGRFFYFDRSGKTDSNILSAAFTS